MWKLEKLLLFFFFSFFLSLLKVENYFKFLIYMELFFVMMIFFLGALKPELKLKSMFLMVVVLSVLGATISLSVLVYCARSKKLVI